MKKRLLLSLCFLMIVSLFVSCELLNSGTEGSSGSGTDLGVIIAGMEFPYIEEDLSFDKRDGLNELTLIEADPSISGTVTIPGSINGIPVTEIGSGAFNGYSDITAVNIPETIRAIGVNNFEDCENLTALEVSSSNNYFHSDQGVLYNTNLMELINFPEGKDGSYEIPEGILSIDGNSFTYCHQVSSITIPGSIVSVDRWTFVDCINSFTLTFKIDDHVQQTGTPVNIYRNPANKYVASVFGTPRLNLIQVSVSESGLNVAVSNADFSIQLDGQQADLLKSYMGRVITFGFRQEDCVYTPTASKLNNLSGNLASFEGYSNNFYLNLLGTNGTELSIIGNPRYEFIVGDIINFQIDMEKLMFFAPETTDVNGKVEERIIR